MVTHNDTAIMVRGALEQWIKISLGWRDFEQIGSKELLQ